MANTNYSSIFQIVVKRIKKTLKLLRKTAKKYSRILECFQLTFIYFITLVSFAYTIKNGLGTFPDTLLDFFPVINQLVNIESLRILSDSDRTFFFYILTIEIVINRSFLNLSRLVKFHIVLVFILELLQNMVMNYWDLFVNRELDIISYNTIAENRWTPAFCTYIFVIFFILYAYSYIESLRGRFPIFPGPLKSITDSAGIWVRIKTSNKKQKKDDNTK